MDPNLAAAVILGAIVVTLLAIKLRRDLVRTYFFDPLEQGRLLAGAVIAILLISTWIRSGVAWKTVTALLIVAFGVAFIVFEQPHKDIR